MSNSGTVRGLLFVVSAPSGTGKTTVVDRLVEVCANLERSRSYTSRPPRSGERDGVDYNFVSRTAFEAMVQRDEFVEWADVFGNLYGTRRADTEARRAAGVDLVLVIDVQGARQVRRQIDDAVAIFVLPPSFGVLERRLRGRSQDSDGAIDRRLATARGEVAAVAEYDYVVINDEFDRCVREMAAVVTAERARLARRQHDIKRIAKTFAESASTPDVLEDP
jgi:guanylate kinase